MKALFASHYSNLSSLFGGAFSITRTRHIFPEKFLFFQGKFAFCSGNGFLDSIVVAPALLATEKEEAKSVLTLFFKKQGLSKAVTARTINKSDIFIDHLVSRLHSVHKSRYLVARELTPLEIRDTLIPYLESLLEEHGNVLVDLVENFPNAPVRENPTLSVSQPCSTLDSRKPNDVSRVSNAGSAGELCPRIVYLKELGMDTEHINDMIRKYPNISSCSLDRKIKPLVEFLLDLGVPKSDIPRILRLNPQLCGLSLSENISPTMMFLEDMGVDKEQWPKVTRRCPKLFSNSRQKLQAVVDFLYELGLSTKSIGKILTRHPFLICYSLKDNLQPTTEYFQSLGVDVTTVVRKCPQILGHSIEGSLKPVTEFFLVRGFSQEEVKSMVSRYAVLYTLSLTKNLIPKWEFFLTLGYSRLELVKFPQYFGCSLDKRIRPRYALVKQCGVKMRLNPLLSISDCKFEKLLKKKREKLLSDKTASMDSLIRNSGL